MDFIKEHVKLSVILLENENLLPGFAFYQATPFVTDIDLDGDGDLFVGDSFGGIRFSAIWSSIRWR